MSNEPSSTDFQINFLMKNGNRLHRRLEEYFTPLTDLKNMDSFHWHYQSGKRSCKSLYNNTVYAINNNNIKMVGIGLNWCFFIGRENEPLDVEMLLELMHTVVRADRVLSDPSGRSLLLIGRSGVGRHTSIKLLSVMHHARIMTPFPGRNYGRKQYTNDLKSVNYKIIRIISP